MLDLQTLAICYEPDYKDWAEHLSSTLSLPLNDKAINQLIVNSDGLWLKISPFKPMQADFTCWHARREAGKKQGLVRACKPKAGLKIIDVTAGWGRDAAILASFGADVLMIERNPIMAILLQDALSRCKNDLLDLSLQCCDAGHYLDVLSVEQYPDIIYIDPMHPARQKSALVKKDMQILQQLIGEDKDALTLLDIAKQRVSQRVVVKWPQSLPPLEKPCTSIIGKTVRFDIYRP